MELISENLKFEFLSDSLLGKLGVSNFFDYLLVKKLTQKGRYDVFLC